MRTDVNDNESETPPLSKIPLIGNLFKRRNRGIGKTTLMIFISPTIIKPRIEGSLSDYSRSKINFLTNDIRTSEEEVQGVNFEQLRDPITRIFFKPISPYLNKAINHYAEQAIFDVDTTTGSPDLVEEEPVDEFTTIKKTEANINNINIINKEATIKELIKNDENPLVTQK